MRTDVGSVVRALIGLIALIPVLTLVACASVSALGSATTWKEEVLLHDGRTMIVERSQTYGGRSEPGQSGPIREHRMSFTPPLSTNVVTWTSQFGEDIGRADFQLLAVHVLNGTPYIVASPNLCLAYNKWGRPNPPYVFFKHEGGAWRRVSLEQFPKEFKSINVALSVQEYQANELSKMGLVSAEIIKELNRSTEREEARAILREPLPNAGRNCAEMVSNGRGRWIGLGWFRQQPSFEACLAYCRQEDVPAHYCPCNSLHKRK